MTIAVEGGAREVDVPRRMRGQSSLSIDQVQEVARLGQRLEALNGWPVDVEFAFAAGQLYLLQCRPITTLDGAQAVPSKLPRAERQLTTLGQP
jgi:pyruvate,water dikinase